MRITFYSAASKQHTIGKSPLMSQSTVQPSVNKDDELLLANEDFDDKITVKKDDGKLKITVLSQFATKM